MLHSNNMKFVFLAFLGMALLPSVAFVTELPAVDGVFGLAEEYSAAALAFWVPVPEGESVCGLNWFSNDETVVFPLVMAAAGSAESPAELGESLVVAELVHGADLAWNTLSFPQALTGLNGGFWIVFSLPEETAYENAGNGGGCGFGYVSGDGQNSCWVTSDGMDWNALTTSHQFAMVPELNTNKSGEVLVLGSSELNDPGSGEPLPAVLPTLRLAAAPNPFNPETNITFSTPVASRVRVEVYDLRGRLVNSLLDEDMVAGDHAVRWNGRHHNGHTVGSGLYLVRMRGQGFNSSLPITLTK